MVMLFMAFFTKIISKFKVRISERNRRKNIIPLMRTKLKNEDFSIVASTCNGGVVCSDLGIRFNSPFVNLYILPDDFIQIARNLPFYMNCELMEYKQHQYTFPVGMLDGDIKVFFMHYKTFQEAKEKWDLRKKRINYNNLFFMMTDRDGCTEQHIKQFDILPYKHKIIFTSKPYPYKSVVFCNEFIHEKCVPVLTEWRNLSGERLYDKYFNFVEWLNSN